jgi:putative lysine transport system permease protein
MEKSLFDWIIILLKEYGPYFWTGTLWTRDFHTRYRAWFYRGVCDGIVRSTPISPEDGAMKRAWGHFIRILCSGYIKIFRGTPMMVQAMVIYYGLRQNGVNISSFVAAVLVILLNTGAYMAESVRGGISAIDNGQFEGAKAMGMSHFTTMFPSCCRRFFGTSYPKWETSLSRT